MSATSTAYQSKSDLAERFGVSVRTFMRWLKKWNDAPDGPNLNLSARLFAPSDVRRIIAQFS